MRNQLSLWAVLLLGSGCDFERSAPGNGERGELSFHDERLGVGLFHPVGVSRDHDTLQTCIKGCVDWTPPSGYVVRAFCDADACETQITEGRLSVRPLQRDHIRLHVQVREDNAEDSFVFKTEMPTNLQFEGETEALAAMTQLSLLPQTTFRVNARVMGETTELYPLLGTVKIRTSGSLVQLENARVITAEPGVGTLDVEVPGTNLRRSITVNVAAPAEVASIAFERLLPPQPLRNEEWAPATSLSLSDPEAITLRAAATLRDGSLAYGGQHTLSADGDLRLWVRAEKVDVLRGEKGGTIYAAVGRARATLTVH